MNGASHIQTARIVCAALAAAVVIDTLTIFAQDVGSSASGAPFVPEVEFSLRLPLQSSNNFSFGAVAQGAQAPDGGKSASELNRELTNPVSST